MEKTKINQIVVLTENIGYGCKTVHSGTICQVSEVLNETHVRLNVDGDSTYPEKRNANICRFRLPESEDEQKQLVEKFEKSNRYARATV
jgi:hypothetical protein